MPTAATARQEGQDDAAKVAASLTAPKWLIGTIIALTLGGGGAAYYTTDRLSQAPSVAEAEAIATRQARAVAVEVLQAHQRWLDERLLGIERQLDVSQKSADKRADGIDKRMDALESELRLVRDRIIEQQARQPRR